MKSRKTFVAELEDIFKKYDSDWIIYNIYFISNSNF